VEIHVIQDQDQLKISTTSAKRLVSSFVSFAKVSYDEASIYFIGNDAMCILHEDYFGDPAPTDCISFPIDDIDSSGYRMMGDVFVCPNTAIDYVKLHGGEVYEEITLYVVHGLLHLLGYDDIEDEDKKVMRNAEAVHLEYIRKNNLWLHP
jgi:probable rRNA maturation factor